MPIGHLLPGAFERSDIESAVQTTKTLLDVDTLIGAPTGC